MFAIVTVIFLCILLPTYTLQLYRNDGSRALKEAVGADHTIVVV